MDESWHLLHVFSTFSTGGPQVRTSDIIQNLGTPFRHTILAMDNDYTCKDRLPTSLPVVYSDWQIPKKRTFHNILEIRKFLLKIKPNLLLTYNWGAIEWVMAHCFASVCPIIHSEDGFNQDEFFRQKPLRIWTRRIFLPHCNCVVVPSHTLENIAKNIWKLPSSKVLYVPNGIDYAKFYTERHKKTPGSPAVVGFVSGLRPVKNVGRLIQAFNRLPVEARHELWLIGEGPSRKELEQLAQQGPHAAQIKFLGHAPDPSKFFKQMDIFALSSDSEQMPICMVEAMAAGCAILSTDVGDIRDLVSHPNREFILPLGDDVAYARSLAYLVDHLDHCQWLGAENQQKCRENYTKAQMMKDYLRIYQSLLEKKEIKK